MPEAEKFNALGAGNGFPFCLNKVNVSGFTYTAPMTLDQVMSVYWNLYSITASASVTSTISPFNLDVSNPNIDTRLLNGVDQNPAGYQNGDREPIKRVCGSLGGGYEREEDDSNFKAADVRFDYGSKISRMYDGDVTNESNFIGYGFGDESSVTEIASASAGEDAGTLGARVALYSWAEEGTPSSWWFGFSVMGTPDTVIETTISGIPFVKATLTSFIVGDESASITGLDFYTYPT